MRNAAVALTVFVACAASGKAHADWARWRGPSGDGRVSAPAFDAQAASRLHVAWRTEVGKGHSAVVVRGDRLYTMGLSGNGRTAEDVIYCLSATTGREIWRYAYPTTARELPGPASTPVVDGALVYAIAREGDIYALDAATGTVAWRRQLVPEKLARTPQWGFCSSPVIEGNLLLVNGGRSGLALDKRTGKVVWSSGPDAGSPATPVVFTQACRRLAAVGGAGEVSVVEVASGKVRWSRRWDSAADPIVVGDRMLLVGGGRTAASTLLQMRGAEPKPLWTGTGFGNSFQSAVTIDGHAYGFGRGREQILQCVDLATGQTKWSHDVGEWGSLIAVNSSLLIVEGDGDVVVAEATPVAFRETARVKAIAMTAAETRARSDALRACWTAPTYANGRVYVRDNHGALVCLTSRTSLAAAR